MSSKQNIIEINGRRYDATTGQPIAKLAKLNTGAPKVIDGFRAPASRKSATTSKPARTPQPHHTRPVQKSKTLHRAAVRASQTPQKTAASPKIAGPAEERLSRANRHQKSSMISKFGSNAQPKTNAEPALSAPVVLPLAQAPAVTSTRPAAAVAPQAAPSVSPTPAKHKASKKRLGRTALHKPKFAAVAAAVAAVLVLGSYFTYLNVPNVALRIAASRAGMDANIPSYQPSGYAFTGPSSYSQGELTLQYKSNTDDSTYQVTEKESNWDSQSLLDNYVAKEHEQHLTFQERGLTVYVYDGSNASWVDGGVWYSIEGDAPLNTEQLLKIASSL